MSRGGRGGGASKIGIKLATVCAIAAAGACLVTVVFVAYTMGSAISSEHADIRTRGWVLGLILAVLSGVVVAVAAYFQGATIASRLTELGLGVAKMGRGSSEVRMRYKGNDEVAKLGRAMQYLATDLAAIAQEQEQGGGLGANMDPKVREMRDLTLPKGFPQVEGFELDGQLSAGSRGGLEYFDCVETEDGGAVLFLIGSEGSGTMSALAARMARDEIVRALNAKATPRKALSHTNRVMHRQLPKGTCATACLLAIGGGEAKLYQAGFRSPLLVCAAGRLTETNAEGLALGLDEGPVFEKGLRSVEVPLSPGVRLLIVNEAALRLDEFVDLVIDHSPKHTAPFMNMVLGGVESEAGEGGLREDVVMLTAKMGMR